MLVYGALTAADRITRCCNGACHVFYQQIYLNMAVQVRILTSAGFLRTFKRKTKGCVV